MWLVFSYTLIFAIAEAAMRAGSTLIGWLIIIGVVGLRLLHRLSKKGSYKIHGEPGANLGKCWRAWGLRIAEQHDVDLHIVCANRVLAGRGSGCSFDLGLVGIFDRLFQRNCSPVLTSIIDVGVDSPPNAASITTSILLPNSARMSFALVNASWPDRLALVETSAPFKRSHSSCTMG